LGSNAGGGGGSGYPPRATFDTSCVQESGDGFVVLSYEVTPAAPTTTTTTTSAQSDPDDDPATTTTATTPPTPVLATARFTG
jgi:hypothetical protein